MGKVVTILNEKGGVGKTSLTFFAAQAIAQSGKRVLMIDMDGQKSNLTFLSGARDELDDGGVEVKTMRDVLLNKKDPASCILQSEEGKADLIPADEKMADPMPSAKISAMKKAIGVLKQTYDVIFLDVSPSPDWKHALVLSCADEVYIAMLSDIMSVKANEGIAESIEEIQSVMNSDLKVKGVVLNQYDGRTILGRKAFDAAMSFLQEHTDIMDDDPALVTVRKAVSVGRTAGEHKTIFETDPNAGVAKDVETFVKLIMEV